MGKSLKSRSVKNRKLRFKSKSKSPKRSKKSKSKSPKRFYVKKSGGWSPGSHKEFIRSHGY